ncbi:MAG: tRNA uridine-5-carboxymethylaminomethyl(34) synthesis GTPase MnmE [Chitinophagaceae bacterium]|nr:tRNA uridine-5-carboxymethylaminomethyl(34) synthesis GTPase MnmE [Chitinophagaceae bacterium]MCZ2395622.1 tRNA uridine-5-carboxymethylaminomethyl(34) synthesis GTPase MnmE [Chitinophagales bacterium]
MHSHLSGWKDTIAAIATPPGIGGIGVIRVSGEHAYPVVQQLFAKKNLEELQANTLHVGLLQDEGEVLDEVVLSLFRKPHSFTGEDVIEISCHGSPFILQQVLDALVRKGARLARAGEFTQRAFLNGKMDLAQAEAVADIINAETKTAHDTAMNQLRGGFSRELNSLRDKLIHFAALIELELDFSDEDVEFADRTEFNKLIDEAGAKVNNLIQSFALGNAIKKGLSVAIIGKPNAGKSTLLNALLNEERAIVSDIAGTTRDTIEETLNINGILFRLIDTAGIREHTTDTIEHLGIERSRQNAAKADIIIYVKDLTDEEPEPEWMHSYHEKMIVVNNKLDAYTKLMEAQGKPLPEITNAISAKDKDSIHWLQEALFHKALTGKKTDGAIVTNARHYEALIKTRESLDAVRNGLLQGLSGDLIAVDIRRSLHYLGEITGVVELDRDILGTIFGKFCIGK